MNDITSSFWSESFQNELNKLQLCKNIMLNSPYYSDLPYDYFTKKISHFFEDINRRSFQISFVGTIKAGKSTLINALLGNNYATVNVTPETAVLTKFTSSSDDSFHVRIKFYCSKEWNSIWQEVKKAAASPDQDVRDRIKPFLQEYSGLSAEAEKALWLDHNDLIIETQNHSELAAIISKYTSSKSAAHYFVKEVYVEIKDCLLPQGIVLCDTPGLDDVLSYRSNITKQYISSSNAIFVCVLSKFLAGEQYNIIQQVFSQIRYNPERVYIIGTQTDLFNNPPQDWDSQKEEWIKYFETTSGYGSRKLASKNIIGISAGVCLFLLNNQTFLQDTDEMDDLRVYARKYKCLDRHNIENTCRALKKATGIDYLWHVIQKNLFSIYKQTLENRVNEELYILKTELLQCLEEIHASYSLQLDALNLNMSELDDAIKQLSDSISERAQKRLQFQKEFSSLEEATSQAIRQVDQCFHSVIY